ncbi:MAG: SPOR domain-containing protein [Candidatus Glassbacteria bacterium]|nr:SPOR domain-containing protein [Candidatus Glassbacteria bacterium]
MKRAGGIPVCLIAAAAFLGAAALRLEAQDMLEVARGQMAAGHAADARVLVENALRAASSPEQRNRALLYRACLETDGDSAFSRLELVCGMAAGQAEAVIAGERLGDLAFSRGDYTRARESWLLAAEAAGSPENRQSALAKAARAELRMKYPRQAVGTLERALAMGQSASSGMLHYYCGEALQAAGDRDKAAQHYLVAYQSPGDPYQLAALYRLVEFYGQGGGKAARQWRDRLAQSAAGSVFGPAAGTAVSPPQAAPGGYSIQLGAFSSLARAEAHAAGLRKQGFDPAVLPAGADKLYRVRIVGLKSRREADRLIEKLKKKGISYQLISP